MQYNIILTMLYESQKHNKDEDFTLHGQACLENTLIFLVLLLSYIEVTVGGIVLLAGK